MISIEACRLRVLFHSERIFRSAGGRGSVAHALFLQYAAQPIHGLPGTDVDVYTRDNCIIALQLIESAARDTGLGLFRDIATNPEQLT